MFCVLLSVGKARVPGRPTIPGTGTRTSGTIQGTKQPPYTFSNSCTWYECHSYLGTVPVVVRITYVPAISRKKRQEEEVRRWNHS